MALPLIFVVAIWQGVLNVAALSTVQAVVPQEIQGRYLATDNALSYAAIPASQIFGGILIATSGLPFTFLLVGIGSVVAGIAFLFLRSLRTFGYSPRAQNEPV